MPLKSEILIRPLKRTLYLPGEDIEFPAHNGFHCLRSVLTRGAHTYFGGRSSSLSQIYVGIDVSKATLRVFKPTGKLTFYSHFGKLIIFPPWYPPIPLFIEPF
jgi:hypothetical protein